MRPLMIPENRFKRRLLAGESQVGLWCTLPGGFVAEALAGAGFDWLLFDTEHSPSDPIDVIRSFRQPRPTRPRRWCGRLGTTPC